MLSNAFGCRAFFGFRFRFRLSRFRFQLWYLDLLFCFKCFNVVCCSCVVVRNAFVAGRMLYCYVVLINE